MTDRLAAFANGEDDAAGELLPLIYEELRRIAHRRRWQWQGPDAPGTTSLVHEAYLNLRQRHHDTWNNRKHFYYFASVAMRNILVDHAKAISRAKRDGGRQEDELEESMIVTFQRSEELLSLDEALAVLALQGERLAQIVECRFFGGLSVDETAAALDISAATVKRGWDTARAWLYQRLQAHHDSGSDR